MSDLVTVILPVYNCEQYIQSAIQSILNQTYRNLEVLVMDDGSKDNSLEKIREISDPRMKVFTQPNQGLSKTLNTLIGKASGKFIARQDQDDISQPTRIEKQVQFLQNHPHVGMVGTWSQIYVGDQPTERAHRPPSSNSELRLFLYFDNPFVHTSVMLRKEVFAKVGTYAWEKEKQPEDYELWQRIAEKFELANLPEQLVLYREIPKSMSRVNDNPFPYLKTLSRTYLLRNTKPFIPASVARIFYEGCPNPLKRGLAVTWVLIVLFCKEQSLKSVYVEAKFNLFKIYAVERVKKILRVPRRILKKAYKYINS